MGFLLFIWSRNRTEQQPLDLSGQAAVLRIWPGSGLVWSGLHYAADCLRETWWEAHRTRGTPDMNDVILQHVNFAQSLTVPRRYPCPPA